MRGIDHEAGIWILLHLPDAVHHLYRLDRELPRGRFGGQPDRVGAIVDGGRHVRRLRSCRRGRGDHRFEHLGGHDHRLSRRSAGAQDTPLDDRHLLGAHLLHAKIGARHHQPVRQPDDVFEEIDGRRLFELGHDCGAAAH